MLLLLRGLRLRLGVLPGLGHRRTLQIRRLCQRLLFGGKLLGFLSGIVCRLPFLCVGFCLIRGGIVLSGARQLFGRAMEFLGSLTQILFRFGMIRRVLGSLCVLSGLRGVVMGCLVFLLGLRIAGMQGVCLLLDRLRGRRHVLLGGVVRVRLLFLVGGLRQFVGRLIRLVLLLLGGLRSLLIVLLGGLLLGRQLRGVRQGL